MNTNSKFNPPIGGQSSKLDKDISKPRVYSASPMTHSTGSGTMTMAELLSKSKSAFVNVQKGQVIKGKITKLTSSEILLDINSKTEAVVLEKDKKILGKILSTVKVGDTVSVSVLNPESDNGNTVVSLRRFIDDIVWDRLNLLKKSQEVLDVVVDLSTKGGFLVTTMDGISGFLPNSHISTLDNPTDLVGKKIKAIVLDLNRPLRKIIFSQKQVLGIGDFEKLIKDLKIGQEIDATILSIVPFGIFVSLQVMGDKLVEGLIHISEISWETISLIPENFSLGQRIKAQVIGFDKESRRINLSIKRLISDPLEKKLEKFVVDKKVKANVLKVISSGVLFDLGEGIVGIIKKEKVPVSVSYKEGMSIEVTVSSIDKKRHRVVLTPVLKEKPIGYR